MKISEFFKETLPILRSYLAGLPPYAICESLEASLIALEEQSARNFLNYLLHYYADQEVTPAALYPFVSFLGMRWSIIKKIYQLHYTVNYNNPFTIVCESLATELAEVTYNGLQFHRYSLLMPSIDTINHSSGMNFVDLDRQTIENAYKSSYVEAGLDISELELNKQYISLCKQAGIDVSRMELNKQYVPLEKIELEVIAQLTAEQIEIAQTRARERIKQERIQLHHFVLDEYDRVVFVYDCLKDAQEDGILKHTNVFDRNGKAQELANEALDRVVMHSIEAANIYNVTYQLWAAKRDSNSVGGRLNTLIDSLRVGGEHGGEGGTKKTAGIASYNSIVEFDLYISGLSKKNYEALMKANEEFSLTRSFKYVWYQLLLSALGKGSLVLLDDDINEMKNYIRFCEACDDNSEFDDEDDDDEKEEELSTSTAAEEQSSNAVQIVRAQNAATAQDPDDILLQEEICSEICADQIEIILRDNTKLFYGMYADGFDITDEADLLEQMDKFAEAQQKLRIGMKTKVLDHFHQTVIIQNGRYSHLIANDQQLKNFLEGLMLSSHNFIFLIGAVPPIYYERLFNQFLDREKWTRFLPTSNELELLLKTLVILDENRKEEVYIMILNAIGTEHLRKIITDINSLAAYSFILSFHLYMRLINDFLQLDFLVDNIFVNENQVVDYVDRMPAPYQEAARTTPSITGFFKKRNHIDLGALNTQEIDSGKRQKLNSGGRPSAP
jgi:hypothetical protein